MMRLHDIVACHIDNYIGLGCTRKRNRTSITVAMGLSIESFCERVLTGTYTKGGPRTMMKLPQCQNSYR